MGLQKDSKNTHTYIHKKHRGDDDVSARLKREYSNALYFHNMRQYIYIYIYIYVCMYEMYEQTWKISEQD